MNPTPRPAEGVVSWNVTTACNLRCSYCTQRHKADRGRPPRSAAGFLAGFARLDGRWEIKMSGGEPFLHPDLDAIAGGIARLGHRVSIVTNFTAPRSRLETFVAAASGRIGIVSCSLHLEHVRGEVELAEFIARALWLSGRLAVSADPALPKPHLCVTSVATRAALPRLPALAGRFADAGLTFKIQPEKQNRDVIPYSDAEQELLLALGGHNLTGKIEHSYRGLPCWAGARSFILDDLGGAWRCYPARRFRTESLGDFTGERFVLADEPRPCLYAHCNCTVPIARGMMPQGSRHHQETEE
ncbi:MAG TPA: radical SAM protein [Candidatus Ozemobacteraceae bacterium]|nr:radical SAM protein [Candidatus Ozemobacteraceae bacterium]